jgi:hypothetical protein
LWRAALRRRAKWRGSWPCASQYEEYEDKSAGARQVHHRLFGSNANEIAAHTSFQVVPIELTFLLITRVRFIQLGAVIA